MERTISRSLQATLVRSAILPSKENGLTITELMTYVTGNASRLPVLEEAHWHSP